MAAKPPDIPWMPAPQAPTGCPPGLEYLSQIDQLLVHQQVELLEGNERDQRKGCGPSIQRIEHLVTCLSEAATLECVAVNVKVAGIPSRYIADEVQVPSYN